MNAVEGRLDLSIREQMKFKIRNAMHHIASLLYFVLRAMITKKKIKLGLNHNFYYHAVLILQENSPPSEIFSIHP